MLQHSKDSAGLKECHKKNPSTKTTFHRSQATKTLKDMEPLFLPLLRRFHVPACLENPRRVRNMEPVNCGRNGGMS